VLDYTVEASLLTHLETVSKEKNGYSLATHLISIMYSGRQDAEFADGTCHNWGSKDFCLHLTAGESGFISVTKSISSTMLDIVAPP